MGITLQVMKDRMSRRLRDISDISNELLYDMATDLNQLLYRAIFRKDPERFIISPPTYNVAASPSTQPLPDDFRDVQETGCGFFIRNNSGNDTKTRLTMTSFGSTAQGYYLDGSNIVFTGINSSTTIVLRYIPVLDDIESLTDTFIVPDEFKDLVLEGMILAYYKNEEDLSESISDQRFARLLEDFLSTIKKSPNVYAFNIPLNAGS